MKEVFGEIVGMLKELGKAIGEAVKVGINTFHREIKELKEDIEERDNKGE